MAGLVDAQAEAHALRKYLVESVLPSPLAPKFTTLYVRAVAIVDWQKNVKRRVEYNIFIFERQRGEREGRLGGGGGGVGAVRGRVYIEDVRACVHACLDYTSQ